MLKSLHACKSVAKIYKLEIECMHLHYSKVAS